MTAKAYLAEWCVVLPLRVEDDGTVGHSPSTAWLGPRNQSAGAMPQGCRSQPSPDVQAVVTFIRRGPVWAVTHAGTLKIPH